MWGGEVNLNLRECKIHGARKSMGIGVRSIEDDYLRVLNYEIQVM